MAIPRVNLTKIKREKGYVYQLDFTVNGKRRRQTVGSNKREAENIQAKIQTDLTLGKYDLINNSKNTATLDVAVDQFLRSLKNIVKENTIHRYKNHLAPFQEFINKNFPKSSRDLRLLKDYHIKECVDYLVEGKGKKQWAPRTVNRMLQVISSLLIFSKKRSFIDSNPSTDVKKLPVPQNNLPEYFTEKELKLIWKELTQPLSVKIFWTWIEFKHYYFSLVC